jgi:hypothetical protein
VRLIDSDGSDLFDLSRDNRSVVKSKSPLLYLRSTHETHGPTLPAGRSVAGVADFNGDTQPDYLLIGNAAGPTIWAGWSVVAP